MKSRMFRYLCVLLTGLLMASFSHGADYPIPNQSRVLFIGNSLTFWKGIDLAPHINAALNQAGTGIQMKWHRVQIYGNPLKAHWNNNGASTDECTATNTGIYTGFAKNKMHARMLIEGGHPDGQPWDYVVLQDYVTDDDSTNSISSNGTLSGDFYVFASQFAALARTHGAIPVLYMRVANNPNNVSANGYRTQVTNLINNYTALGRHLDVLVVPIAKINDQLTSNPPSGQTSGWLYRDEIHPNANGLGVQFYTFASLFAKRSFRDTPVSHDRYVNIPSALDSAIRLAVYDAVKDIIGGTNNTAPAFTTQPASVTKAVGTNHTFSVVVTGTPTPTLQWRKDGVNISGATGTSYTLNNIQSAGAGTYTVVATNSVNSATSSGAVLTVTPPPSGDTFVYQAESLTHTQSDPVNSVSETAASGGQNDVLAANAVGDFVEYSLNVASPGSYTISVTYKALASRGIARLSIGGTPQGDTFDQRATGYRTVSLGSRELSAGTHLFRFQVTGTSGTGYSLSVDAITLVSSNTPQPPPPTGATTFEAENLNFAASDTVTSYNDDAASAGSYDHLAANAVGDYVEYTANVATAGTYTVKFAFKGLNSRGTAQVRVNGEPLGSPVDQRPAGYRTVTLGQTALLAGPNTFRLQVTGSSGTGFSLSADAITIE
jgi:hypothetical protein